MYKTRKRTNMLYSETPDNENEELTSVNLRALLGRNADIQFMDIYICGDKGRRVTLAYIDGLVDKNSIGESIVKPLTDKSLLCRNKADDEVVDLMTHGLIYSSGWAARTNINDAISDILSGGCAVVFDAAKTAVTFHTKEIEKRGITEPTNENAAKGAKDSFVESLRVNTATVRSRIKSQKLVIEETAVGKQTLTSIGIVYMDGVANQAIVDEVKERLNSIDIDGVIIPGFIEEYLIDRRYTAFPQILATERPDKFCTNLLDGRVGLLIDGMPIAYDVPAVLFHFLRTIDDYSQNFFLVTAIRILRYAALMITLLLPAFYIAITTFHQEMIPTELAISIVGSKEGVPYPSFLEVIFLQIAFELLLEAGLRLPKSIGQAISVVGALVVGEAVVNAKLMSPAVVVVIALTVISGFTLPNQDLSNAIRLWRLMFIVFSSMIGLFGIGIGALLLLYELSSIETFGVPYLSPFVSNEGQNLGDSLIRVPLPFIKKRPAYLNTLNKKRQK